MEELSNVSSRMIDVWCGMEPEYLMETEGPEIYVIFVTNGNFNRSTFRLEFFEMYSKLLASLQMTLYVTSSMVDYYMLGYFNM